MIFDLFVSANFSRAGISRQQQIPGNAKQDPLFQDLIQFFPTGFQSRCVCVNPIESGNLAVERAVVGQDFVYSPVHGSVEILSQHEAILLCDTHNIPIPILPQFPPTRQAVGSACREQDIPGQALCPEGVLDTLFDL